MGRDGGGGDGVRDWPLLPAAAWPDESHQGRTGLLGAVLDRRGHRANSDLPWLYGLALAHQRPATRLRVPRRRAQDDLLLRGGLGAHAGQRSALLAFAPALWDKLPADRYGGLDLRVRGSRLARVVPAGRLAHPRRDDH